MLDLLNDPEIDKLIIYGLAGVCAVLLIAVIFLAVKKNVYYVDEDGDEVVEEKPRRRRRSKEEAVETEEPETPVIQTVSTEPEVQQGATTVMDLRQFDEEPSVTRVMPTLHETEEPIDTDEKHETLEVPLSVRHPSPRSAVVAVTVGGQKEHREITNFPCLIGRETTACDLVISEPAVSRRHARLVLENDELFIEDVSEHNGTYLNGTKLAPLGRAKIHEGDHISLGRADIEVSKLMY